MFIHGKHVESYRGWYVSNLSTDFFVTHQWPIRKER